ncbi:uncharacterized protein L969DRAFT_103491 [Mixia osmundae IAM 14324]|uniref:uncharacterized protein n=1 Tax=Mixia osmundae (strain CBS 9802 / IAM 14324 / JCM 22182 / KY 12970) TaxID=764103 RepID=UPI0004A55577|nr:uncharacterized protein L969DRAFT_103491 [Mixia osmundae IAM 14324]KEI39589.1 hypothetical protein L969DRAFT_103491 [Mixia osmundae IAM 14324]
MAASNARRIKLQEIIQDILYEHFGFTPSAYYRTVAQAANATIYQAMDDLEDRIRSTWGPEAVREDGLEALELALEERLDFRTDAFASFSDRNIFTCDTRLIPFLRLEHHVAPSEHTQSFMIDDEATGLKKINVDALATEEHNLIRAIEMEREHLHQAQTTVLNLKIARKALDHEADALRALKAELTGLGLKGEPAARLLDKAKAAQKSIPELQSKVAVLREQKLERSLDKKPFWLEREDFVQWAASRLLEKHQESKANAIDAMDDIQRSIEATGTERDAAALLGQLTTHSDPSERSALESIAHLVSQPPGNACHACLAHCRTGRLDRKLDSARHKARHASSPAQRSPGTCLANSRLALASRTHNAAMSCHAAMRLMRCDQVHMLRRPGACYQPESSSRASSPRVPTRLPHRRPSGPRPRADSYAARASPRSNAVALAEREESPVVERTEQLSHLQMDSPTDPPSSEAMQIDSIAPQPSSSFVPAEVVEIGDSTSEEEPTSMRRFPTRQYDMRNRSSKPQLIAHSEVPCKENGWPILAVPPRGKAFRQGRGMLVSHILGAPSAGFHLGMPWRWQEGHFTNFDLNNARLAEHYQTSMQICATSTSKARPPTVEEMRLARPHPHALFNTKRLGWTLLTPWPASKEFAQNGTGSIPPRHGGLGTREDCKAHHYITTPCSIDPRYLLRKSQTAQATLGGPSLLPWSQATLQAQTTPQDDWISLVACTWSSRGAALTQEAAIPSIIDPEAATEFESQFRNYPPAGETAAVGVCNSWLTIWRICDAALFPNGRDALPMGGDTYNKRIAPSPASQKIFTACGFVAREKDGRRFLIAPDLDPATLEGCSNRATLARAWLEIGLIFMSHLDNVRPGTEGLKPHDRLSSLLRIIEPNKLVEHVLGGNNIGQEWFPNEWLSADGRDPHYRDHQILGTTPSDPNDFILFAYDRQAKYWQECTHRCFDALKNIAGTRGGTLMAQVVSYELAEHVGESRVIQALQTIGCLTLADPRIPRNIDDPPLDISEDDLVNALSNLDYAAQPANIQKEQSDAIQILTHWMPSSDTIKSIWLSIAGEVAKEEPMTLERAYATFEISADMQDTVDDDILKGVYAVRKADGVLHLDAALRCIAEARQSAELKRLVEGDDSIDDPIAEANMPIGLQNIGNTCYLNSLLQYLYTIRALREAVLRFPTGSEDAKKTPPDGLRVGGRHVSQKEITRSHQFLAELQVLFNSLASSPVRSIAPTKQLAYLALVSTKDDDRMSSNNDSGSELTSSTIDTDVTLVDPPVSTIVPLTPAKRNGDHLDVTESHNGSPQKASAEIAAEPLVRTDTLERLSAVSKSMTAQEVDGVTEIKLVEDESQLDSLSSPSIILPKLPSRPAEPAAGKTPAKSAASPLGGTNEMMFGKQNDVSECLDNVLFQIEVALSSATHVDEPMTGIDALNVIQSTFFGKTRQMLTAVDSSKGEIERLKEETFVALLLNVSEEGRDIYDGLDAVFDESEVESEGVLVTRSVQPIHLPPVLQIQLQRAQFDRMTKRSYKSNVYVAFEDTICLDRYLTPAGKEHDVSEKKAAAVAARRDMDAARLKLDKLQSMDGEKVASSMSDLNTFLSKLGTDHAIDSTDALPANLQSELEAEARHLLDDKKALETAITDTKKRISDIWAVGSDSVIYDLASVFMHQGVANAGHYYLYSRALPKEPDRWIKYNDSIVSTISKDTIFADTTGSTNNPYFLCYQTDDRQAGGSCCMSKRAKPKDTSKNSKAHPPMISIIQLKRGALSSWYRGRESRFVGLWGYRARSYNVNRSSHRQPEQLCR